MYIYALVVRKEIYGEAFGSACLCFAWFTVQLAGSVVPSHQLLHCSSQDSSSVQMKYHLLGDAEISWLSSFPQADATCPYLPLFLWFKGTPTPVFLCSIILGVKLKEYIYIYMSLNLLRKGLSVSHHQNTFVKVYLCRVKDIQWLGVVVNLLRPVLRRLGPVHHNFLSSLDYIISSRLTWVI